MITIEQLDNAVKDLVVKRKNYDEAKKESDFLHGQFEEKKQEVIELLNQAGKTSYRVDGVALISASVIKKVKTPKTLEEKAAFFDWLKTKHGEDGFFTYATINYNSLNSLYNAELAESGEEQFTLPGIPAPENEVRLSIRRA
jgi:hypothetical protein